MMNCAWEKGEWSEEREERGKRSMMTERGFGFSHPSWAHTLVSKQGPIPVPEYVSEGEPSAVLTRHVETSSSEGHLVMCQRRWTDHQVRGNWGGEGQQKQHDNNNLIRQQYT